jgi:hypothetical protein
MTPINIDELKQNFQAFVEDLEKFNEKGMCAPAARARKSLLKVGKLVRSTRKQIQEAKVAVKSRFALVDAGFAPETQYVNFAVKPTQTGSPAANTWSNLLTLA